MPPSIDRETHRRNHRSNSSSDDNDEQAGRRANHDRRRNHHRHTNNNTMTLPQVTPEQMQEFYAQRIFGAAVGRLAADQQERGGEEAVLLESELMRHSRSVAAEMPPTLDETYVLRLQSQLALARYSMDRIATTTTTAAPADGVADESNLAAVSSTTARQLASAAARLRRHDAQMQAEAAQSLGLVAELQVDLARTRERMSDALSVARSTHSSRSINFEADLDLLNEVSNANADHNSDAASLDLVGPLELDLNDVEPEANHRHQPQQHRSAPLLPTHNQPQPQEQGEERTVNDEAELLASIASLQLDLLQTRERLMDERSFSHSHHINDVIPSALEEATPEASESTIEGISAQNQSQEEEEQPAAAGAAAAAAAERSQQEGEVNDAAARLPSLTTAAAAPKTTRDSSVRGTRIRSQGDLVFRRFSNQMA